MIMQGGCQCGAVRFEADVNDFEAYLCHCRMCQRAVGNVSVALVNLPQAQVKWMMQPARYASSPIAERLFCSHCGTSLGFAFLDSSHCDLPVAAFDNPAPFVPHHNFGIESCLPQWQHTSELPGQRTDEWPSTVNRWQAAGMEPPHWDPSAGS